MNQNIIHIHLERLSIAPENTRKAPVDKGAQGELIASIFSHGLLENLVVRADEDDQDMYFVVAGGRRLSALRELRRNGNIQESYPVPCLVIDNGDSHEISLAENTIRVAMHPADQVEAFAKLADHGYTTSEIATRFGVLKNWSISAFASATCLRT